MAFTTSSLYTLYTESAHNNRTARLGLVLGNGNTLSPFAELLDGENGDIFAGTLDLVDEFRLGLAIIYDKLDGGGIGDNVGEDREKISVGEYSHTLWFV